eukprot:tig00020830_g14417.t1
MQDPMLASSADFGFQNPLLAAKNARKRAETDAQLLDNRLRRLKIEEDRARKKIEETRRRAAEILQLKERNVAKVQVKQQMEQEEEERLRREREIIAIQNAERREVKKAIELAIVQTKKAEAATLKKLSRENQIAAARFKEMEVKRAQMIRDSIKAREIEAVARIQKQRVLHEQSLGQTFEERVAVEEDRRRRAEEEVLRMEQEEAALIERLRHMQARQRKAYEELEGALTAQAGGGPG